MGDPTSSLGRPLRHFLVTIETADDHEGLVALELWGHGAVGVEDLEEGLRAAFTDEAAARRARDALAPRSPITAVDDGHGIDRARDLLTVEVGGGFAVHPPWLQPPAGSRSIVIDPGHAFGSGSHPSTRLALALVESAVTEGHRVLDVGCGTGVLAIAAALLGATVVAVDTDPAAVDATIANAARNGVTDHIDVRCGTVAEDAAPFDLVVINVTIDIHEQVAPNLTHGHPRLVVSGLLGADQLERAAAAHRAQVAHAVEEEGWMAALLVRP